MVNMKVVEKFEDLKKQRKVIEDWYCTNCQECDCSLCPYDYELVMPECNVQQYTSRKLEDRWIPVKSRPMDEEERIEWSERLGYDIEYEEAVIYVSQLPDDGEEVLTCDRYGTIRKDTFSNDPDEGCYFEENGDMDGIVAWMPLPKPYKEEQDGR